MGPNQMCGIFSGTLFHPGTRKHVDSRPSEFLLVNQNWPDLFLSSSLNPHFTLEIEKSLFPSYVTMNHSGKITIQKTSLHFSGSQATLQKTPTSTVTHHNKKSHIALHFGETVTFRNLTSVLCPFYFYNYISFRCSGCSLGPKAFGMCVHMTTLGIFLCCSLLSFGDSIFN